MYFITYDVYGQVQIWLISTDYQFFILLKVNSVEGCIENAMDDGLSSILP